jgi:hypothetical protein
VKYLFFIISVLSFLYGLRVTLGAKSAIHEIEAGVSFVIFIISLGFGSVLSVLRRDEADIGEKKCPFCAEFVKKEAIVCKFCGKNIPVDKENEWGPIKNSPAWGPYKQCPHCGEKQAPDTKLCPKCGWKPGDKKETTQSTEKKALGSCPICKQNEFDGTFCKACGHTVK